MADDKLSTVQEKALDLIIKNYKRADGGMTIEEIAKAVKRSRQTVSSWMNHHKLFRSEYDRRIRELNKYATAYAMSTIIDLLSCNDERTRLGAAKDILDRGGFKPKDVVDVSGVEPVIIIDDMGG